MSQPDPVTVADTGGSYTPHPEGQYAMTCLDVVDLGIAVERYGDQEPREAPKVALVFGSGARAADGTAIYVTTEMTLSMGDRANLRKFLGAWRGKSYTDEQARAGVPLHKLHGKFALVSIEHVTTRRGRVYAKIAAIGPLPPTVPPPADLLTGYERPQFLLLRKAEYASALARHRAEAAAPPDDPDDDVPF